MLRPLLNGMTLAMVLIASTATAANLDLTPLHRNFDFNFGNPGARSLGMGGAFIGRVDDASAAEANPAGLTVIAKPEATIEFRRFQYSTTLPSGCSCALPQTPFTESTFTNSTGVKPSFASVAFPVSNFVLAGYYYLPLDYEQKASLGVGLGGLVFVGTPNQLAFAEAPGDYTVRYKSEVFGLAGAWHLGGLSLGLTARSQKVSPETSATIYPFSTNLNSLFARVPGAPIAYIRSQGSPRKFAYSAGVKWNTPSENFSVGAVYKYGPRVTATECNPTTAGEGCSASNGASPSTFEIPTQYGAGLSIRPIAGVTLNADIVHVQYSRLLEDFQPAIFQAAGVNQDAAALGYRLKNATEVHAGGEWAFPTVRFPFAVRAGWWHDPVHSLQYTGPASNPNDQLLNAAEQIAVAAYGGEVRAQNHIAFGLGYLGRSFEVNGAYDHASRSRTAAVSLLKRF